MHMPISRSPCAVSLAFSASRVLINQLRYSLLSTHSHRICPQATSLFPQITWLIVPSKALLITWIPPYNCFSASSLNAAIMPVSVFSLHPHGKPTSPCSKLGLFTPPSVHKRCQFNNSGWYRIWPFTFACYFCHLAPLMPQSGYSTCILQWRICWVLLTLCVGESHRTLTLIGSAAQLPDHSH